MIIQLRLQNEDKTQSHHLSTCFDCNVYIKAHSAKTLTCSEIVQLDMPNHYSQRHSTHILLLSIQVITPVREKRLQ